MTGTRMANCFLSGEGSRPLWEMAQSLGVPVYVHPEMPPKAIYDTYCAGLGPALGAGLASGGWGWQRGAAAEAHELSGAAAHTGTPSSRDDTPGEGAAGGCPGEWTAPKFSCAVSWIGACGIITSDDVHAVGAS